ncbi:MAG TPA: OmpA family protein [Daejeonella sp.]|nr:OmpA family protein [Daejeonella sp.]
MNLKKVLPASLVCLSLYLLPQNIFSGNIEKANKYYEKYDYKFALDIYEKIMQKKPSLDIAQKLANCYRFVNDTQAAELTYAQVLTFAGAPAINYKYYADMLKQNGRFDLATLNYLKYGKLIPAKAEEAQVLANSCQVARMWSQNPDMNVHIENERSLNSEYSEFSPVKYGDDLVFVSDRWFVQSAGEKNKKEVYGWTGNPYMKLYSASNQSVNLFPKPINTDYHTGSAFFNAAGNEIYFTRIETNKKTKGLILSKKAIFYSKKVGSEWTDPQVLPFNKDEAFSVQHPALSPDGNILYFASDMPGGYGGMDIYASKKQDDGTWGKPVNCGPNINTAEDEVFPMVNSYNGKLYFASKGHIGMGGLDIFNSEGSYDQFAIAENLKAPINSSKDDFGILFSDENSGYLSSNRSGGQGQDDIYRFKIIPAKPEKPLFVIDGQVMEKNANQPIQDVPVYLINTNTGAQTYVLSDADGKFSFELEEGMDYIVKGDSQKFYSRQEGKISSRDIKESTVFKLKLELERADDGYLVRLNNIYYDFNKWNIRPGAVPDLDRVTAFMNSVKDVNIQLRSHTDARGPAHYNLWLSQKRAQSAVNYLKKSGVEASRLSALGLGETELLNRCKDGVRCSAADHQLNRRTEFKVIKVKPVTTE